MKATTEEKEAVARKRFAEYLQRFAEELHQSLRDERPAAEVADRWLKVGAFLHEVRCRSQIDQMRDLFVHFLGYLRREGLISLPVVEDLPSGLPVVVSDPKWKAGYDAGAKDSGVEFYRRSARVDLRLAGWSLVAHCDLSDGNVHVAVKDEIGRTIVGVGKDDATALDDVRATIARRGRS